jgi:hypothetical protein
MMAEYRVQRKVIEANYNMGNLRRNRALANCTCVVKCSVSLRDLLLLPETYSEDSRIPNRSGVHSG